MRYYGHLFFNLHGPIGKSQGQQHVLANMLSTFCSYAYQCLRNH
jgi:hypothetical protein